MDQTAENLLICRACLKIVELRAQSYGYIEDANGNLRDMMMCCVPEMDIFISPDPIICFPCIQHLVNVYNFKTRCINTETIIRSYIQRNNLSEYSNIDLSCVVQDLIKINQFYKEQEERRKIATKVDGIDQERFGENDFFTHSNATQVVNDMLPQATLPATNNISPFSIPAPINNIPHINAQSIVNMNHSHINSLPFAVPQPSSHNHHTPMAVSRDILLPLPSTQNSTSVSIPQGQVGPIPPVTGLFSLQANPNGPIYLVRPTTSNIHQSSNLTPRILSENPPPLHFPHNSHIAPPVCHSEAESSLQEKQNIQEPSSRDSDSISKGEAQPFLHPIESKMRLVIRIPRSRITIPYDKKELESHFPDKNELESHLPDKNELESHLQDKNELEDGYNKNNNSEYSNQIENRMEDVEMSEIECLSNALDLYEESNQHEDTNIPVERSISRIYNCTCMYLTTSEALFNEHKKVCRNDSKNLVRCPHCPHVTNRPYALTKHINTMHTKAVWFLCEYCTYRSTDKSCLRRHMRKNHLEKSITETVCQVCGHVCSNQYNLSKHMTRHEISASLNCDFCSYTTKDRSNFRKHIFTHNTKQLDCEFCSYQTPSPYQMKLHLKKLHDGVGIEDIDCRSDRPVLEIINDIKAAMEEHPVQNYVE